MEYSFSGITHYLKNYFSICIIAIVVLVISKIWDPQKRDKKGVLAGLISLLVGVAYTVYFLLILVNPHIESFTGTLEKCYRKSRQSPSTYQYIFSEDNERVFLYLDRASMQKIYPEGLIEGCRYEVHYVDQWDTIVGIIEAK